MDRALHGRRVNQYVDDGEFITQIGNSPPWGRRGSGRSGFESQCCIADLPPGRFTTLHTSPRKICNIADLPPEDLQHCRPSSRGEGLQHCRSSPFHCRSSPGEDLQHCRLSTIFVKLRILIFECIKKGVLIIIKDCTYTICKVMG